MGVCLIVSKHHEAPTISLLQMLRYCVSRHATASLNTWMMALRRTNDSVRATKVGLSRLRYTDSKHVSVPRPALGTATGSSLVAWDGTGRLDSTNPTKRARFDRTGTRFFGRDGATDLDTLWPSRLSQVGEMNRSHSSRIRIPRSFDRWEQFFGTPWSIQTWEPWSSVAYLGSLGGNLLAPILEPAGN